MSPKTGLLLAGEVGLVVPRQCGKGSILEAVELGWLFLSQEELVLHSAHEFKTAADAYKRLKGLIQARPELESLVKKWNNSHGQEGIELTDGRALKFVARTAGSGRGFPAKKIILDESYDLTEAELAALLPTLTAAPDAQVWYTSSPVNQEFHANGVALARVRERGINGEDPELCYLEWSNPDDLPLSEYGNPEYWAAANPGYGIRLPESSLRRDFKAMSLKSFGVEHLGIGDWPSTDVGSGVITVAQWDELEDPESRIVGKRLFTFDIAPYGERAAIGVCGKNADGLFHLEVVESRSGTRWLLDRLTSLSEKWKPLGIVYDPRTPSAALESDLTEARLPLIALKGIQIPQAFAEFHSKVTQSKNIRHPAQPSVSEALTGATTRQIGDGLAWNRKDVTVDITGLIAITNALYAYSQKLSDYVDVAANCW